MKRYNRGIKLSRQSREQLNHALTNALSELARIDSYVIPDNRASHVPYWVIRGRRNVLSRIGRINAALRIKSDREFGDLVSSYRESRGSS